MHSSLEPPEKYPRDCRIPLAPKVEKLVLNNCREQTTGLCQRMLGEPSLHERRAPSPPATHPYSGPKATPVRPSRAQASQGDQSLLEGDFLPPEDKGKARGILGLGLTRNLPIHQFPGKCFWLLGTKMEPYRPKNRGLFWKDNHAVSSSKQQ